MLNLARQAELSNVGIICTKSDVSKESYICRTGLVTKFILRTFEPKKPRTTGVVRKQKILNDSATLWIKINESWILSKSGQQTMILILIIC